MRILGLLAAALLVTGAEADDRTARPAANVARCGHVDELLAAKTALARGDDAEALRHLEAADALLQRCEREGIPAEPDPEVGAIETGRAGSDYSSSRARL
jgi:hypothetical protein